MATGDQNDFAARLRSGLPGGWFPPAASPTVTPILDGILAGLGACFAWVYSLIAYANLQGRIASASGVFLDIIGLDFLGSTIARKMGQTDLSWRAQILQRILAPNATRPAMIQALTTLTGRDPVIFEPKQPMDTGGYSVGGCGYAVGGGYGSMLLPFQCFVTAYRPKGGGVATVAGYGNPNTFNYGAGGYGVGAIEYATPSMILGAVTDLDIQNAVIATSAEATIPWLRITN